MTYGYQIEPLASTAVVLGIDVPRGLLDIVTDLVETLPITAAHGVYGDGYEKVIYWVSGSSLVVVEGGTRVDDETGPNVPARATVRSLRGVDVSVAARAIPEPNGDWTVYRALELHFDDEVVELPDPRGYPLNDAGKRAKVKNFTDAVLTAVSAP